MTRKPVRNKKPRKSKKILFILLITPFFLALIFLYLLYPASWDGNSRLTMAVAKKSGDANLVIFDPERELVTTLEIPGNTQVNVAHQLGTWKIESVWLLGENEGLAGQLFSDTIIKSFRLPVDKWSEEEVLGFAKGGIVPILQSLTGHYKSNLSFKDKVHLSLFSLKINTGNRVKVDLTKVGVLEPRRLLSGEDGYVINRNLPLKLSQLFTIDKISEEGIRIAIVNASGNPSLDKEITDTVEVLGAKVVLTSTEEESDSECDVVGSPSLTAEVLSRLFSCKYHKDVSSEKLDLRLKVGKKFAERF